MRNNFFKVGIILAALSLGFAVIAGYFTFDALPDAAAASALRSRGIVQVFMENYLGKNIEASAYVPLWVAIASAAFSFVSLILIYYFFEKTQSPEILFIGLFVITLAFEFARMTIPLKKVFPFPALYIITASRVLFFSRYFGLFSLLAASVYAAGMDAQKQQNMFIMLILACLIISLNVPVDSLVWDSAYVLQSGYRTMLSMVETGILAVTAGSFFISVYLRGFRSYAYIGIGTFIAYAGKSILIKSDNWITPLPGLILLILGIWMICSNLRKVYLWL